MAYLMAAMAVGSMIQANEARNAQMKAKAADAKLQRAKLQRARVRASSDYATNMQRAREAAQRREIKIEENRLNAQARADLTFAGSGISGQSVSELDNEIDAAVSKNKFDNRKALDTQLTDMTRNYSDTMTDSAFSAGGIDTATVEGNFLGDAVGAVQAASSVQGLDRALSEALRIN